MWLFLKTKDIVNLGKTSFLFIPSCLRMRIRAEIFHATIVYHTVSRFDIISHVKEIGKRVVLFKHLLRENKVALRFTFLHESTLKDFSYNIRHEKC